MSSPHSADPASRRTALLLCVPVVLAAGLAARFGLDGAIADLSGGAAYTAFAYVLIALARPRWTVPTVAAGAFGFSVAIELFQLTGIPADLADQWSPVRLVLGTDFVATDLIAYAAGAATAAAVDLAAVRSHRSVAG